MIPEGLKRIPRLVGYYVDNYGQIFTTRPRNGKGKFTNDPRPVRPFTHRDGYSAYNLSYGNRQKKKFIFAHIAVLTAFRGKRPKGMFGCHGILGQKCNHIDNLYWATPSQNSQDKRRDGTASFGEKSAVAKLSDLQVRVIKRLIPTMNNKELSLLFHVSDATIWQIRRGNTWTHIHRDGV